MSTSPVTTVRGRFDLVSGWGVGSRSAARIERVETQDGLERIVQGVMESPARILPRGLGRSYGDAAQCAGGTILDCTSLDRVVEADLDHGRLRVEAGMSLDALLALVVPAGWFVPVTPGTRHVTIGGAIAADVHGKNHHRDGAFGTHVEQLSLITARGRFDVGPTTQSDLYWATVGGVGLTGTIVEATLRLHPIESGLMTVDTLRAGDLDECMAELAASDDRYRYSVAWVDCVARGRHLGRSVLSRGDHARLSDLPPRVKQPLTYRSTTSLNVPMTAPFNLVSAAAVRAGNELWYRKAPARRLGELQSLSSFFYPLDAVGNWNRLYGPRGFTQYQFVVPFGEEQAIRKCIEYLHAHQIAPSLGVLKRFGDSDLAPLSFPIPGWTLALDLPLGGRKIGCVLDGLDELVAEAHGRVYLAKDGRLRPEIFKTMYPRLDDWLETRAQHDPTGVFASDLSRRLGITAE